jgi:dTDP-4-amino-4,6-dideoxygalactose transaminase
MPESTAALAVAGGAPALSDLPPFPSWPQGTVEEENGLLAVLRSGKWGSAQGDVVASFEGEFAEYQGSRHAVAAANGTVALVVALRALGVGLGDEVIVPSYTFFATAAAPLFVGALPVFVDIDPRTHLMDPVAVRSAITDRTKAIIPVHIAGNIADMDALLQLKQEFGIPIIEDAAQAAGAYYKGGPVGAIGDIGTFSFQSSKNIASGEGGILVTNDDALSDAIYSMVNVGRVRGGGWYEHRALGYNLRLSEFQGAVLRAQLRRHPEQQELRAANAARLRAGLIDCAGIELPPENPDVTAHGHHLFMMRFPELGRAGLRDAAVRALQAEGVPGVFPGYVALHQNEALLAESASIAVRLGLSVPEAACPMTELVCADTIWLGQHVLLGTENQINGVIQALRKVAGAVEELRAIAAE